MAGGRSKRALEATAYHEASHVLVALQLGFKVGPASIVPNEDSHGRSCRYVYVRNPGTYLPEGRDRADLKLQRNLIAALAGVEGQRMYSPRSLRNVHGRSDHDEAAMHLARFGWEDEEIKLFLPLARYRAKAILERCWEQVEALAAALMEKGTLTRSEILTAISVETLKAKPPRPASATLRRPSDLPGIKPG
jgi:hypothetical protein